MDPHFDMPSQPQGDEDGEYHCENCNDTGWDWENAVTEDGCEYSVLVPCDCIWCMKSCHDIKDAYERSPDL